MKMLLPADVPVRFTCCGSVFDDVANETFIVSPWLSDEALTSGLIVGVVFSVGSFELSGLLVESGDVSFTVEEQGGVVDVEIVLNPRFVDQNFSCIKTTHNTQTSI